MNNKTFLGACLFAGALVASSAVFAGGPDYSMPKPSFTGFYAGVNFGIVALDYQVNAKRNGERREDSDVSAHDLSTIEGLHLGYGYELPQHFYVGAQATASIAQFKQSKSATYASVSAQQNNFQRIKTDFLFDGQVNLGYAVSPSFLPTVIVGYTVARNEYNQTDTTNGTPGPKLHEQHYLHGPLAGLGLNLKVANHFVMNTDFTTAFLLNDVKTRGTRNGVTESVKFKCDELYRFEAGLTYLF